MSDADYAWMENAFVAFAEYSFNVAHATVYGITAYRCAYLAARYPVEFHAALLSVAAGTDKEEQYLHATRERNIQIRRACINSSGITYAVAEQHGEKFIRKGLISIKGVGRVAAGVLVAAAPFSSLDDFISRANPSKISGLKDYKPGITAEAELVGVMRALHEAHAFTDAIGPLPLRKGNLIDLDTFRNSKRRSNASTGM